MSNHSEKPTPFQVGLAALFVVLTFISFALAHIRFVGVWGLVSAIGPPLMFGGFVNVLLSPQYFLIPRSSEKSRQYEKKFPASVRVLLSLVPGYVMWIPFLLAMTLS